MPGLRARITTALACAAVACLVLSLPLSSLFSLPATAAGGTGSAGGTGNTGGTGDMGAGGTGNAGGSDGAQDTSGSGGCTIILENLAEVDGPWIRLGDIARIEGDRSQVATKLEDIEIGRAALPGQKRVITLESIKIRLRQARVDFSQVNVAGPDRITVVTRHAVVSGQGIADEARRFAESTFAGQQVKVTITRIPQDLLLPVGRVSFSVQPMSTTRFPGNGIVMVVVLLDGQPYRRIPVSLEARVVGQVVVAARTIQRYEVISQDAIRVETREISHQYHDVFQDAGEVLGKRATRTIQEGSLFDRSSVEVPPTLLRGARVTIVATMNGMTVTGLGEALEDGKAGDVIRVKNLDTGRQVQAVVRDATTVEVVL